MTCQCKYHRHAKTWENNWSQTASVYGCSTYLKDYTE